MWCVAAGDGAAPFPEGALLTGGQQLPTTNTAVCLPVSTRGHEFEENKQNLILSAAMQSAQMTFLYLKRNCWNGIEMYQGD